MPLGDSPAHHRQGRQTAPFPVNPRRPATPSPPMPPWRPTGAGPTDIRSHRRPRAARCSPRHHPEGECNRPGCSWAAGHGHAPMPCATASPPTCGARPAETCARSRNCWANASLFRTTQGYTAVEQPPACGGLSNGPIPGPARPRCFFGSGIPGGVRPGGGRGSAPGPEPAPPGRDTGPCASRTPAWAAPVAAHRCCL